MIYTFGQFELDTRIYELRSAGTPRPVEPQVFDVLAYLVQHRDRVISKEELLERLWPDRFVSESTLTSRLKEARKAVGDTGRQQAVIKTHHGRGYRFVAVVDERSEPSAYALTACVSGDHLVPASSPIRASGEQGSVASKEPRAGGASEPFVGRAAELTKLTGALDLALDGSRQMMFISGEAGVGKTTLVETFLARYPRESALIARGQCVEHRGSGEPYMPLLDALGRLGRQREGPGIIDVLRREAPSWLVQLPFLVSEEEHATLLSRSGAAGERMLRELCLAVERVTREVPLILLIEDLHWCDYATLDAIDLLARQTEPARLLVLGTYRPSDLKATRHPIHALSQELRVRGQCEVISLPLLGTNELDDLLVLRFGNARFTSELARILHVRTAGNPLFVENLIESWIAREMIRLRDGDWSLEVPLRVLETDVPDSLQRLIEKQMGELDDNDQRILEAASVIGRVFPVALVSAVLPAADDDVERDCETLVREGRFIRDEGSEQWGDGTLTSRFAFAHDLYVDVLYDMIPTARRARLHQQAARVLERAWSGREREKASELALHFQRANDRERAPRFLRLAAEQALERSAYREAVAHLTAALELLSGAAVTDERSRTELAIRCRLAPALIATRGYADQAAEENYLRARDLALDLGENAQLSQTLYGMANMYEYRGQYQIAEAIANERISLDGTASLESTIESHELLTCSLLHQGRYREAVEHGEMALAAFEEEGPFEGDRLVLLVQAHGWISGALFFAGRADDARAHSDSALRFAEEGNDELARASAAIQAAFLRFYLRDVTGCRSLSERGLTIARERRFPFHVACGRILRGWCLSIDGDHDEAVREIRAGIRTCNSIGARMDLPLFQAILSEPLAASGDLDGALAAVDEGLSIIEAGRAFFYQPELHRLRGLLLLERVSERTSAIAALRHAFDVAREQDSPALALRAAVSLFQSSPGRIELEGLRSLCASIEQGLNTFDILTAHELLRTSA